VGDSPDAGQKPTRAARVLRRSLWLSATLAVLVSLLTCAAFSPPSPYRTLSLVALIAWVALGAVWVVQLLLMHRLHASQIRLSPWFFPAVALLTFVLGSFDVPSRLTYLASRDAMNRAAHDVMTGKRDPQKIRWIGIYPVSNAYGDRYGFWFSIRGTNTGADCLGDIDNDSGFVFSGSRKWMISSAPESWTSLSHHSGNWYSYGAFCGSA